MVFFTCQSFYTFFFYASWQSSYKVILFVLQLRFISSTSVTSLNKTESAGYIWRIGWFKQPAKPLKLILYLEVTKLHSLYVYIDIFLRSCFVSFWRSVMKYSHLTLMIYTQLWFRVTFSLIICLHAVILSAQSAVPVEYTDCIELNSVLMLN